MPDCECGGELRDETNERKQCTGCGVWGCGYCIPHGLCEDCRAAQGKPEPFDEIVTQNQPSVVARKG